MSGPETITISVKLSVNLVIVSASHQKGRVNDGGKSVPRSKTL